jgi:cysteine desulfurase
MSIYLDYAASTPMNEEVLEAMKPYFSEKFHNPSATYLAARAARQDLVGFRAICAGILGARPAEIIFTSGATEANNLAVSGIAARFKDANILVSAIEHDSVLVPAAQVGSQTIPVLSSGQVDMDSLAAMLDDKTVLISVMLVNNELGTTQPIRDIARMVEDYRRERLKAGNKLPLYLHTDAAQAANYLDLHTSRLGVDMMSINGGKIYGPKGSGLLYVRAGTQLSPLALGGGQELGLRSGTENLPAIAGLAKALEKSQSQAAPESRRVRELARQLETGILAICPDAVINGGKHRAPHLVNVTFPGRDNEILMMKLDELGVECALGSACSASSLAPSHVLKAIGLSDKSAHATLRFSLGRGTTADEIAAALRAIEKAL